MNIEQKLVWDGLEMCTQVLSCSCAHGLGLAGALVGGVQPALGSPADRMRSKYGWLQAAESDVNSMSCLGKID